MGMGLPRPVELSACRAAGRQPALQLCVTGPPVQRSLTCNSQTFFAPQSPVGPNGGQSSPTVYSMHSRRSSTHSSSEPPQEVAAHHVKFVRDTSRYWYKPHISREEAITLLREAPPGTFVVRDSNSFPGAFGLALKVAVPPATVAQKAAFFSGDASELVRHFLIEPTSRGVKLKGCTNEPVFTSLSALVYQHSIMAMALPCKLLLPDGEIDSGLGPGGIQAKNVADLGSSPGHGLGHGSVNSAQQLLAQGAGQSGMLYSTRQRLATRAIPNL